MGFPPAVAELYAEMYAGIASGRVGFGDGASVERGTTTPAEFLDPVLRAG
ncbi:hypothetical protein ACFWSF_33215 [Streptomyces sp. NPDC058611]